MINLVKMEFYRLRVQKIFWVMLAAVFILGLVIGVSDMKGQTITQASAAGEGGVALIAQMMTEGLLMGIGASIFAVIYLGRGFAERTPGLSVEGGASRSAVFLSQAVVYLAVVFLTMAAYVLAGVLLMFFTLSFSTKPAESVNQLLGVGLLCLLTGFAVCSAALLFLVIFRDSAKTTLFSILALMLQFFLSSGLNLPAGLRWVMPLNQMFSAMPLAIGSPGWMSAVGIDIVFLVVSFGTGGLIFSKRELK